MATRKRPKKNEKQIKAYQFLLVRAGTSKMFTLNEIAQHCGWKPTTPKTHVSKQWKDYLILEKGRFRVKAEFLTVTQEDFLRHASQVKQVFTHYERTKHEHVISYEFLLPLTKETELRKALDNLFYSDTIKRRIDQIGLSQIEAIVPRAAQLSDEEYVKLVVKEASVFGGYSISHVRGRFRAGQLITRQEAGKILAEDGRYLVDETTAAVRFIIPCATGKSQYKDDLTTIDNHLHEPTAHDPAELEKEVRKIRGLFFHLFVEAIVQTVKREDEIWLLESGPTNRVYIWSRVS